MHAKNETGTKGILGRGVRETVCLFGGIILIILSLKMEFFFPFVRRMHRFGYDGFALLLFIWWLTQGIYLTLIGVGKGENVPVSALEVVLSVVTSLGIIGYLVLASHLIVGSALMFPFSFIILGVGGYLGFLWFRSSLRTFKRIKEENSTSAKNL